ncbi:MAG: hypothetical protein ABJD68_07235 [Nakamurella sp.]
MTSAEDLPGTDEQAAAASRPNGPGGDDDVLEGGSGVGATSSDEPDTFEPEEAPE